MPEAPSFVDYRQAIKTIAAMPQPPTTEDRAGGLAQIFSLVPTAEIRNDLLVWRRYHSFIAYAKQL
jgi:hypothetical protein